MFNSIINFLEENGIEIKKYRGQLYDNASSMSDKNGLHRKIISENKLVTLIPCMAHSLYLVGKIVTEYCLHLFFIF